MKAALQSYAEELGFDICRITACTPPPHSVEFEKWLEDGHAGEMAWLERNKERRLDPQQVLPNAKSIIVLGMNYWQGEESPLLSLVPKGRIARYAWGKDYHDIISEKLKLLDLFLQKKGGLQKTYVDTGPVLERDFAAEAGVGWHGKSTMLINPKFGTWFFLAEILTTLDLEKDTSVANRCGTCTRCVDACPTNAITHAHHIDARRCISYLTIELKGSIPLEFRPLIGDRIYGCDECLAVCPWNRFAQLSRESSFAATHATEGMTLVDYLELDDDGFRTLFRGSPIKRIKRRGFLRNVCVALGNIGTPRELPALEKAARDPEPLIAEHAQWAIGRIQKRFPTKSPTSRIPQQV